ncbi:MAG: C25 family cysteine peptidase, partial [Candidatus Cloacimonetes bacterium]|nr:C25 family cysteine peptidase [Candidatus Cloacimonadota bacterium]
MRSSVFIVLILLIPLSLVAEIRVISQSPDQISLEYRPEAYQVLETGGFTEIRAQGMALPLEAGVPALPYSEIKVAIPPKASISVSTHTPRSKKLTLESKIKPSPRVSSRQGESGNFFEIDEASYHHSQAPLIEALEESSFRGYAFVPIIINPFRYDGNLSLETVSSVIIEIRINGDTSFTSNLAPDEPARIFLKSLINAEYAAGWRNEQRSQVNYADFSKSDVWVRIETNKEGMHKISPSQLSFLNLEDIDPSSFRLFTTGGYGMGTSIIQSGFEFREVPIQVIGADDGSFDPEDYIVFFGTDRSGAYKNPGFTNSLYHNPYSQNGVFWLTHAGEYTTEALRMEALPKPASHEKSYNFHPHTVRVEQEAHRWEEIGFNWFMQKWFGQTTSDYTFNVNLEDVVADSLATLSFSLIQENIGSVLWHRMNLYINDQLYQQSLTDSTSTPDLTWYSTLNYNFNRNTRLFQEGTNTLRFKVFRSQTINYFFDYYEISYLRHLIKRNSQYPLKTFNEDYSTYVRYSFSGNSNGITVYQAQNYADVKILTHSNTPGGFEFIGSGNLNNSYWIVAPNDYYTPVLIENYNIRDLTIQEQIDNLIITIPEFSSQADELAEFYNQTYGIHSKVVMQDDIFNQFNGGHPDPVAIRQYIRYLYHNQPAPRISSLTMLGIGTIDWRNYSGQAASKNKVIVFQQNSDTSDDLFGLITTSFYPEIAIGRYPVRNSSELNTMLNNMYSFVQNPNQGEWKNKVLIVADDLMNGISQTGEYYHTESAEATNLAISRGVMVDMVLGIEHDYDEFQNKPSARDAMMKVVNDGTLVWYYIGHGSYDKLGAEDYFNGATDMGRFNNPDKLNLFIAASCEVGQFDYWGFDALSQKVVTMNNQGSIASVAATRKTPPTSNEILMIHFLRNVVNNRYALGFALSEAKRIF